MFIVGGTYHLSAAPEEGRERSGGSGVFPRSARRPSPRDILSRAYELRRSRVTLSAAVRPSTIAAICSPPGVERQIAFLIGPCVLLIDANDAGAAASDMVRRPLP